MRRLRWMTSSTGARLVYFSETYVLPTLTTRAILRGIALCITDDVVFERGECLRQNRTLYKMSCTANVLYNVFRGILPKRGSENANVDPS